MRVFVAGATGAIGRPLVPRLVAAGHEVHGMTRSESKRALLSELGAVPVLADALDPDQVAEAVARAMPEVIVHELTAIGPVNPRHLDRDFAQTNRLRTKGTDYLLSAGQAVGVRRFVAQGVAGYAAYARTGGAVKSEDDPLDAAPAREMRETAAAIHHLEQAVLGARWTDGIVLRYGVFYGPGTTLAPGEEQFELVRRRKFPLVGDAGGVWSFIHIADAAEATVAAVEHGSQGVYNVVDDDPAQVAEWPAGSGRATRRQEADARAAARWAAVRWGGRCGDDDRGPRRLERQGQARAGGDRGRGLHGVARCGGGDHRCGLRGALGRTRRDASRPRAEASCQDGSQRLQVAARSARRP
jgi:nucleoside-diphosphate-sugar epimerase